MDVGEVLTIWVRDDVIVALLSIHQDFWKFITKDYVRDLQAMNEAMGLPADHPDPDLRCETLWACQPASTGMNIYVEEVQFFALPRRVSYQGIDIFRQEPFRSRKYLRVRCTCTGLNSHATK